MRASHIHRLSSFSGHVHASYAYIRSTQCNFLGHGIPWTEGINHRHQVIRCPRLGTGLLLQESLGLVHHASPNGVGDFTHLHLNIYKCNNLKSKALNMYRYRDSNCQPLILDGIVLPLGYHYTKDYI